MRHCSRNVGVLCDDVSTIGAEFRLAKYVFAILKIDNIEEDVRLALYIVQDGIVWDELAIRKTVFALEFPPHVHAHVQDIYCFVHVSTGVMDSCVLESIKGNALVRVFVRAAAHENLDCWWWR